MRATALRDAMSSRAFAPTPRARAWTSGRERARGRRAIARARDERVERVERVDALLSRLGYCTRSTARAFASRHEIVVDGTRVRGVDAKARASTVRVDGEALDHPDGVLVAMHKPRGTVCSHDEREGANVYELLPERWRRRKPSIETIGRLDKDTSGLLLLTDDGALNHALTSPKKDVGKWYRVRTDGPIPRACVEVFASGELTLSGEEKSCKPAMCEITGEREARLRLTEGKFHQVKRMFAFFDGLTVVELHRESFGGLKLEDVAPNPGDFVVLPTDYDFTVGEA